MSNAAASLPATATRLVTDAGMETDLIFHHGLDLPDFAAFPLLDSAAGRAHLSDYYDGFAAIAAAAGAGLLLEGPTWRANPDWGTRLGYAAAALGRVNRASIKFLAGLRDRYAERYDPRIGQIRVSGMLGPRGDGYQPGAWFSAEEAAEYHGAQLAAFAAAGADQAAALTLTSVDEAIGIVQAADAVRLPIGISFTVETDARLPDGTSLADAIAAVDAVAAPDYFMINCAHPDHIAPALAEPGSWRERIHGVRYNSSTRSHAELDEAEELDEGDPGELAGRHAALCGRLPAVRIVGGCCGTDSRHVAALWGV